MQARRFHGHEDQLVEEHRATTTPVEEYILLAPPKQKIIYMSKKSNEISRRRWPYELHDTPLNLPSACCELFTYLDTWAPGWRRTGMETDMVKPEQVAADRRASGASRESGPGASSAQVVSSMPAPSPLRLYPLRSRSHSLVLPLRPSSLRYQVSPTHHSLLLLV
eukprot:COSAG02_NODE_962_length_15608_cov_16.347692_5_plen_165_part_00